METSLIENVHLKELHLDGCDAFLCIMGKALSRNTSLHKLRLNSKPLDTVNNVMRKAGIETLTC